MADSITRRFPIRVPRLPRLIGENQKISSISSLTGGHVKETQATKVG